jgi:Cd2+/Zn2+-exporting ATPase
LRLAGAIESRSGHPLAAAIARKAQESGAFSGIAVEDFQEVAGRGVMATIDGRRYVLGNPRVQRESGVSMVQLQDALAGLEDEAKTVVTVSEDGQLIGMLGIADIVRPGAQAVIQRLARAHIRTIMLTGDNERSARAIADQLGLDEFRADLLPIDKVDVLKDLRRTYGCVAMVGDGINDAPAMAESNVGIAMGAAGSDVAVGAGDIVLMSDDLSKIGYLCELSARAVRTVRQNIVISLVNIAFMVSAALAGYLGLVSGLLLNEASALVVIFNAVSLLKWSTRTKAAGLRASTDESASAS